MHKESKYLSEQTRHVYKKVESSGTIDTYTLKQEIEQEEELSRLHDTSGDINPYRELIVNNVEKVETVLSQMEQWSILSNVFNYVQYDKHPRKFHSLNISGVNKENYKRNLKSEGKQSQKLDLDFSDTPGKLKGEYLDIYKRIQLETLSTSRFDENKDLNKTYLGRVDVIKESKIRAEESFLISEQRYMMGKLLNGMECQVLLDTGVSKSFMSKSHYFTVNHSILYPNLCQGHREFK